MPCEDYLKCDCRVPHDAEDRCKINCDLHPEVGHCIPVPSTPAIEGRTVYALFSEGKFQYFTKCSPPTSADNLVVQADIPYTELQDILIKAQLLKCHQSESAEIEEQLTEIVCSQYTRAEKAEAKIKELKGLTDSLQDKIETIRADQNKKIGEWLKKQEHNDFIDGTGRETYHVEVFESDIAKLQKGEF
jgi:hypothetical protein